MRTAVVAYEMEGERTGVGRYLEGLLTGLARLGEAGHWLLYFKGDPFDHPLWSRTDGDPSGPRFEPIFDRRPDARPILWEQLRLPTLLRRDRPERVFSPAYSLPATAGSPGIVTVHDLSFEILGDDLDFKERWRRRLLARRAVRKARRVLTDTEEMARDLRRLYKLPYDKVGVVPLGIDARFLDGGSDAPPDDIPPDDIPPDDIPPDDIPPDDIPPDDASAHDAPTQSEAERLAGYGIRAPYLLYLGSILDRRRIELVVRAFARLPPDHRELSLVLAGRNRLRRKADLDAWISGSGVAERVVRVGYVREEDLVLLYRRATLSYYLSTYEGYGLPPMESLAAGTPAVVSRGLALDELWEDYPFRVPTLDLGGVTRTTRRALDDEDARAGCAAEGAERMARLDWRHAARAFLDELRRT